jgi:transposase
VLTPRQTQRIYLAVEPVDMRGGFDRLACRVLQAGLDLYSGHLFVFVSKRRTHLKILTWDGSGLVVLYKRLAKGRFQLPDVHSDGRTASLDATSLAKLLEGCRVHGVGRSSSPGRTSPGIDTSGAR